MIRQLSGTRWRRGAVAAVVGSALVLSMSAPASATTKNEHYSLSGMSWSAYETVAHVGSGCTGEVDLYWSGAGSRDSAETRALQEATAPISNGGQFAETTGVHYMKFSTIRGQAYDCVGVPAGFTSQTLFRHADPATAARALTSAATLRPALSVGARIGIAVAAAVVGLVVSAAIIAVAWNVVFTAAAFSGALALAGCVGGAGVGSAIALVSGQPTWKRLAIGAFAGCATGAITAEVGVRALTTIEHALPRIADAVSQAFAPYSNQVAAVSADVLANAL